ncbi:MAG: hypothetical protein JW959_03580 [Pirellulales bacterium]|nr:hypothetical protein [Pirellulales bacterium]
MTEPNPSNHWDALISSLGATPPDEEAALRQPEPKQPEPAPNAKLSPVERSPRPPADWNLIAGELGVDAPPEKIAPSAETPAPLDVAEEPSRRVSVTPERGDESPNFFDEKFDFEEPFDLLESGKAAVDAPKSDEPAEEHAEKRSKKRRRRRRPEKDVKDGKPGERVRAAGAESDRGAGDEEALSSEQRRSKHRRPRRGKQHLTADGRKPTDDEPAAAGKTPDIDDDADEREDKSVRAGFRGIPTWSEAVGLLIEKNLASRASRPSAQRRGRGKKRRS